MLAGQRSGWCGARHGVEHHRIAAGHRGSAGPGGEGRASGHGREPGLHQRLGADTGRGDRPAQQRGVTRRPGRRCGPRCGAARHVRVFLQPGAQEADGELAEGGPGVPEPERPHPSWAGSKAASAAATAEAARIRKECPPRSGPDDAWSGRSGGRRDDPQLAQRPRHHGLGQVQAGGGAGERASSAIARKQRRCAAPWSCAVSITGTAGPRAGHTPPLRLRHTGGCSTQLRTRRQPCLCR